jgi:hypothetical protein
LPGGKDAILDPGAIQAPRCLGSQQPGNYCQLQLHTWEDRHLTLESFYTYSVDAAALMSAVPQLDSGDEVAAAVCDNDSDAQLERHLSTVALDLVRGRLAPDNRVMGEVFEDNVIDTVGEAFAVGVAVSAYPLSTQQAREDIKDILNNITNGASVDLASFNCW